MESRLADRLLTIAVTATLTSAFWIVAGGSLIDRARERSGAGQLAAEAAPSPPFGVPAAPSVGEKTSQELLIPVQGVRAADLSDTFDDRRGGGARLHEALDIMAPEGSPVIAAAPGTVEKLFKSDPGGNTIYVRSPDRLTIYYYAHLREYAPGLAEGDQIRRGEPLGTVGHTGNASAEGPHLHFAMMRTTSEAAWYEPATALNPYPLVVSGGR